MACLNNFNIRYSLLLLYSTESSVIPTNLHIVIWFWILPNSGHQFVAQVPRSCARERRIKKLMSRTIKSIDNPRQHLSYLFLGTKPLAPVEYLSLHLTSHAMRTTCMDSVLGFSATASRARACMCQAKKGMRSIRPCDAPAYSIVQHDQKKPLSHSTSLSHHPILHAPPVDRRSWSDVEWGTRWAKPIIQSNIQIAISSCDGYSHINQ
jgi:hypothetical protein